MRGDDFRLNYPQGDVFDFEQFFRANQEPLERFIGYRVGSTSDTDDLVAESMCQLLAYCRRSGRMVKNPRALLFKIARNRLADYYTQRQRTERVIPLEDAPPIAAQGSMAETIAVREECRMVADALEGIHETYREALALHAIAGLSIGEIAETLGKSTANVRMLLHRARRSLRKELRRRGGERDL